jgi:hypothetical protein
MMVARLMFVLRSRMIAIAMVVGVTVLMAMLGRKRDGGSASVIVVMVRATAHAHVNRQQDGRDNRDELTLQHVLHSHGLTKVSAANRRGSS